jgi:hypothetical protein
MTTHKEIVKALKDLGAKEFTFTGDNLDDIVWFTDSVFTKAEIELAMENPLPEKEPTIDDKLASVGLSVNDLKAALGI